MFCELSAISKFDLSLVYSQIVLLGAVRIGCERLYFIKQDLDLSSQVSATNCSIPIAHTAVSRRDLELIHLPEKLLPEKQAIRAGTEDFGA